MFGKRGCLGTLLSIIGIAAVICFLVGFLDFDDDSSSYSDDDDWSFLFDDFDDWYVDCSDGDYYYISDNEINEGYDDASMDDLIDCFFDYYGFYPDESGDYNFLDNDEYSDYAKADYENDDSYDQFYGSTGSGGSGDSSISSGSASELAKKFIKCAQGWLGTPYVFGGTSRSGIDCSGLIYMAAKEAGLGTLPRNSRSMYSICTRINKSDLRPGDLVFFAASTSITHVALFVGDGQLLHAISDGPKTGVCYSKLTDSYWKNHYYASGRIISDNVTASRERARNETNARAKARNQGPSGQGQNSNTRPE